MSDSASCCGAAAQSANLGHETVLIERPKAICRKCEDYAAGQARKPVVVMCCEGACLRGEIARRAAHRLCFELAREETVRLCLGGAFTKDTGQRALVRNAARLVAVEGCGVRCATRMMRGVLPGIAPEEVIADAHVEFDKRLFAVDEMPEARIAELARGLSEQLAARIFQPAQCR